MTQEQFRTRVERADKEVFVITTAEDGWRIRSARNPSQSYLVSTNGNGLVCSCPDFQTHTSDDPDWTCKHVLAVEHEQAKANGTDFPPEEEPVATAGTEKSVT